MVYLVIHLACALFSILLQTNESGCDLQLGLLYVLFGPFGLIGKIISIIL